MKVTEHLLYNEKKIASRSTAIQSQNKSYLKVLQLAYVMTGQKEKADHVIKRIEKRGPIAQEINLDINMFKQKKKRSLLEDILRADHSSHFVQRGKPIIVVPTGFSLGNICLGNCKSFLQDGKYVSSQGQFELDLEKVDVEKKINEEPVVFEVYDSVANFTYRHWRRVVAIFLSGQEWQLKDWPHNNKMVELFLRVRGYYMRY